MKKRYHYLLLKICSIMIVCSFLSVFISTNVYATGFNIVSENVIVQLDFNGEKKCNTEGIQFDVFRLKLKNNDKDAKEYEHVYVDKLFPNRDGQISFKRPSDYSYIKIDKNTIPDGYGIKSISKLIGLSESKVEFTLEPIQNFEYDFLNDSIKFYDGEYNELIVNSHYNLTFETKSFE